MNQASAFEKTRTALTGLATKTMLTYRQTVVALAGGEDMDPEQVQQICLAAHRSLVQLQADIDTVVGRTERQEENRRVTNPKRFERAKRERDEARAEMERLLDDMNSLRTQAITARQRDQSAIAALSQVQQEQQKSPGATRRYLEQTAAPGTDPTDPLNFKLAD